MHSVWVLLSGQSFQQRLFELRTLAHRAEVCDARSLRSLELLVTAVRYMRCAMQRCGPLALTNVATFSPLEVQHTDTARRLCQGVHSSTSSRKLPSDLETLALLITLRSSALSCWRAACVRQCHSQRMCGT